MCERTGVSSAPRPNDASTGKSIAMCLELSSRNRVATIPWHGASSFTYVSDADYMDDSPNSHRDLYGISSPNMNYVPLPYVSIVTVYLRSDYRYGVNDPFQWPQTFTDSYNFLCAVRRRECAPACQAPLWWTPTQADFRLIEGSVFQCLGFLRRDAASPLFDLVTAMDREISNRTQHAPLDVRLTGLHSRLQRAHDRLQHQPCTFRDACFQVRELQRSWLMCRAAIDYTDLSVPTSTVRPTNDAFMGAFTTFPAVVQHLHAAGIPVWFVRQDGTFDKQEMERVMTSPRHPVDVETGLYMSDSPALWRGLSDERHLHVICRSQHQYVDVSVAPLLYRYDAAVNRADNNPSSTSSPASSSSHSGSIRHAPCKPFSQRVSQFFHSLRL